MQVGQSSLIKIYLNLSLRNCWNTETTINGGMPMFNVLKAVKEMSKAGSTVVDNSILNEVGDILYGLNVNYTVDEIDKTTTKLYLD
jgi:hypothetical protein